MGTDSVTRTDEFLEMRRRVCEAGTDSLSHFGGPEVGGYTHEGGLALQQNPDEFAGLCLYLQTYCCDGPLLHYLEVGAASGGTTLFLDSLFDFDHVVVIDDGQHPRFTEQWSNLKQLSAFGEEWGVVRRVGDSHDPMCAVWLKNVVHRMACGADAGDVKFDLVFIDGDHSYEGVTQDIALVRPHCHEQTLVVLHDIVACDGVKRAWQETEWQPGSTVEFVGDGERLRPLGIGVGRLVL